MASSRVLLAARWPLWLALLGAGCEGGDPVTVENEGEVCFYEVGTELVVSVVLRGCLSNSCDVNRRGECSVSVDGSEVTLESRLSYTELQRSECDADCGTVAARCTAPLPPDGPLTVHFGELSGELIRDADGTGLFGEPRFRALPNPCSSPPDPG